MPQWQQMITFRGTTGYGTVLLLLHLLHLVLSLFLSFV